MRMKVGCILVGQNYQSGDQPPEGYIDKQEWAKVQMKAGLRQQQCKTCWHWKFPQELSDRVGTMIVRGRRATIILPVCRMCVTKSEDYPQSFSGNY